jgi:cysteine desulfurase / selenocysteine lyase
MLANFPILKNGIVYLDSAATSQKPQSVIDSIVDYYNNYNSNVHRGAHKMSALATSKYEEVRMKVAKLIGCEKSKVVFTKGTTDAINLVANSYRGKTILVSEMEHHSNIVPWQLAGCKLKVIPVNDNGELIFDNGLLEGVDLVAVTHISNTTGVVNDVKSLIDAAHGLGVKVLIDGAQAIPHTKVDVSLLDCDYYAFSGHKMYGPTGVGILYVKDSSSLVPYQGGGSMISDVSFSKTTYADAPHKFEAGTPNIAGIIGLGSAIDFINSVGYSEISSIENNVHKYALEKLSSIDGLKIIGKSGAPVISFVISDMHHADVSAILDKCGIAVRSGHHCTLPLMRRFGLTGTVRASFAVYNTVSDVDKLIDGIIKAKEMLVKA